MQSIRPTDHNGTRPRPHGGGGTGTRGGFTLVELTIVLVLIAITVAVIIPEMKGTFEGELLRSNGRKLVRAFNLAHAQTVTIHKSHRVRLNPKDGRFVVERPAGEEDQSTGFIPLRDLPGAEGTIDTRISTVLQDSSASFVITETPRTPPSRPADPSETPNVITFFPDGTAQAREIVLEDRSGFRLAVRVNPITARVKVVQLKRP